MQLGGALGGASTRPRRWRLNALLAIAAMVVIAGVVALMVWVVPLATSWVETEEVVPKAAAGSAVIHDDAGNVGNLPYPLPHGKVVSGTGSAVIHDDAGNMPAGAGSAVIHDDAGHVTPD